MAQPHRDAHQDQHENGNPQGFVDAQQPLVARGDGSDHADANEQHGDDQGGHQPVEQAGCEGEHAGCAGHERGSGLTLSCGRA
jgi:hypothetical protein